VFLLLLGGGCLPLSPWLDHGVTNECGKERERKEEEEQASIPYYYDDDEEEEEVRRYKRGLFVCQSQHDNDNGTTHKPSLFFSFALLLFFLWTVWNGDIHSVAS
jgi:hypothetical protein